MSNRETAADLIAKGYRLYWVEVSKSIPVLAFPGGASNPFEVEGWSRDDGSDWQLSYSVMRHVNPDERDSLPFCEEDIPDITIGELLDAQKAVDHG